QLLDRVNELRDTEGRFTHRGAAVERLVGEGIHSLARTDLVEAQQSARRALHTSLIAVLVLLVAGIVIGSATALPAGRSIVSAEVAEDLRPAADARRHRLERVAPARGPWVPADPTRLAQLVSNLVYIAVKYTPEGGLIRLEVESVNGEALLRVRDNGVGIAPEMRSRIFDPFVQGDDALTPQQGGLGIGLTLVRRLVELHDGRIEVESPGAGRGSTFTVRLPALENAPAATPAPT